MVCQKNRIRIENNTVIIVDPTNVSEVRLLFAGCPDCNNSNCPIKKYVR